MHCNLCLQVEKTQSAMEKEQGLASKLKEEINAVNSNAQKKLQLEQERAEATAAEKALVEKTLDAERQKVRPCLCVCTCVCKQSGKW